MKNCLHLYGSISYVFLDFVESLNFLEDFCLLHEHPWNKDAWVLSLLTFDVHCHIQAIWWLFLGLLVTREVSALRFLFPLKEGNWIPCVKPLFRTFWKAHQKACQVYYESYVFNPTRCFLGKVETVQVLQSKHIQYPNNPFYDCNNHLSTSILVVCTNELKYIP